MRACLSLACAAIVLASDACTFASDPPKGAVVVCTADADCPHGQSCDTDAHECAAPGEDRDTRGPALALARFTPSFASTGAVDLAITGDEDLGDDAPVLAFDGVDDPGFTLVAVDGRTAHFSLDAGAAQPGAYPLGAVTLTDRAGNHAVRTVADATLVIDRDAPVIVNLVVTHADGSAGPFADVDGVRAMVIGFAVSEAVDAGNITVSAGALTTPDEIVCTPGAANTFQCAASVVATAFTDVSDRVTVRVVDRAGNVGEASATIATDLHGPSAVDVTTTIFRPGGVGEIGAAVSSGVVEIELITDEPLGATPLFSIAGDAAIASQSVATLTPIRYRATLVLGVVGDAQPTAALAADVVDKVGNPATIALGSLPLATAIVSACGALTAAPCVDFDGDGDPGLTEGCAIGGDCDDTDPLVHTDAIEIPGDGVDNDCIAGDLAIDESIGVFVDANAPPDGVGSASQPFDTLDEAIAALGGRDWFFLAGSAQYTTAASFRGNMIGGLDPSMWSVTAQRSQLVLHDTSNLGDDSDHLLAHVHVQRDDVGDLNALRSLTLDDCDWLFGTRLYVDGRLIMVGGAAARLVLVGTQPGSLLQRVEIDDDVELAARDLLISSCTSADHESVNTHLLYLAPSTSTTIVNSSLGAVDCDGCANLRVWSSVLFGTDRAEQIVLLGPNTGTVEVRDTIFAWTGAPAGPPAVVRGDTSGLSFALNLIDDSLPNAIDVDSATGGPYADANQCNPPECAETFQNTHGQALLSGDDVHVSVGSDALGIGTYLGDADPPAQAAADFDGECRSADVVDIGADQR